MFGAITKKFHIIGSSEHTLVGDSLLTTPPPPAALFNRQLWHSDSANWISLRNIYVVLGKITASSGDASVSDERMADVIVAGIGAYIPFFSKTFFIQSNLRSLLF